MHFLLCVCPFNCVSIQSNSIKIIIFAIYSLYIFHNSFFHVHFSFDWCLHSCLCAIGKHNKKINCILRCSHFGFFVLAVSRRSRGKNKWIIIAASTEKTIVHCWFFFSFSVNVSLYVCGCCKNKLDGKKHYVGVAETHINASEDPIGRILAKLKEKQMLCGNWKVVVVPTMRRNSEQNN